MESGKEKGITDSLKMIGRGALVGSIALLAIEPEYHRAFGRALSEIGPSGLVARMGIGETAYLTVMGYTTYALGVGLCTLPYHIYKSMYNKILGTENSKQTDQSP